LADECFFCCCVALCECDVQGAELHAIGECNGLGHFKLLWVVNQQPSNLLQGQNTRGQQESVSAHTEHDVAQHGSDALLLRCAGGRHSGVSLLLFHDQDASTSSC
jgi:hypothetical protein